MFIDASPSTSANLCPIDLKESRTKIQGDRTRWLCILVQATYDTQPGRIKRASRRAPAFGADSHVETDVFSAFRFGLEDMGVQLVWLPTLSRLV